jgi:hypothetical protein
MFMQGCPPELEAKYDRIQSRSLVMRNLFGLSAGVKRMIYWDLINVFSRRDDLMCLMYGKIALYGVENGAIAKRSVTGDVFARMSRALAGASSAARLDLPDQSSLYVFKVEREGASPTFVAWERRDSFSGEGEPAAKHVLPWSAKSAEAVDIFGKSIPVTVSGGHLQLEVSVDPIFIHAQP